MGQIWDRISRIAKSTFADSSSIASSERIIRSDDDELRRIIEELTKEKDNPTTKNNDSNSRPQSNVMTVATASAMLGVAPDAPPAHIKSAYRKKLLEFHPDRVLTLPKEQQETAREKTIALNAAYQFLRQVKNF